MIVSLSYEVLWTPNLSQHVSLAVIFVTNPVAKDIKLFLVLAELTKDFESIFKTSSIIFKLLQDNEIANCLTLVGNSMVKFKLQNQSHVFNSRCGHA